MANFDLSKLMEGKNPQAVMLAETRQLKSKWEQTGLLEGLNAKEQGAMSVLLENQAKQLLDEASATGTANNSEEWSGVALPLVRRIFGEIASKEFVSVQPMNLPSGLVFYLDFKYGSATAGRTTSESLFGGSGAEFGRTDVASNGLYGDGRFGYSINEQEAANITISGNSGTGSVAQWSDVGFDAALSASVAAGEIFKITTAKANIGATADEDAATSFIVSGSGIVSNVNQFNKYDGTNFVLFVSASSAPLSGDPHVKHSVVPVDYARGDFEQSSFTTPGPSANDDLQIPEVDLELKSEAIVAKTRKLKAVWTPELAQDLNA